MDLFRHSRKISKNDINVTGGRGAQLGEMVAKRILVPPAFVISPLTFAFEKFLKETDLPIDGKAVRIFGRH